MKIMNNDISNISNSANSRVLSNTAKSVNIWMFIYVILIFIIILSVSAFIFFFISGYTVLIYINVINVLMLIVSIYFALKYSAHINKYNSNNIHDTLLRAFIAQRNYLISLTSFIFIIVLFIVVYLLYMFLYVQGMK